MEENGKLAPETKPKKFVLGKKIITGFSFFITFVIVITLIMTGPAQALTVGIQTQRKEVNEGNWIYFYSKVDLHRGDLLNENTLLQVEIIGGGETYSCLFDLEGEKITECENIKVKRIKSYLDDVEYGELNITGIIEGEDEAEVHSIGYGYGFTNVEGRGYDEYNEKLGLKTELVYKVFFRAPQVDKETEYTIAMKAFISNNEPDNQITIITDEQNQGKIKVKPLPKKKWEVPKPKPKDDDDDDNDDEKPKKPKKPKDKDDNDDDNDNGKGNDNKCVHSKCKTKDKDNNTKDNDNGKGNDNKNFKNKNKNK